MQGGLDGITTEEIAGAAGVSTRTFFNYFPNKEAAAIGLPPGFAEADTEALRQGTASLGADLKRLLDRHMETMAEDEALLLMVGNILRSNEKARGILDGFLTAERDKLTETLCSRVNNRQTAAALATNVTDAVSRAIFLWEHEENMTLPEAANVIWEGLLDASRLLLSPRD